MLCSIYKKSEIVRIILMPQTPGTEAKWTPALVPLFSSENCGTATFCYRVGVLTPYLLMYLVCRSIFLEFILTITAVVVGFISSQGFYWQNNSSFTVSKGKKRPRSHWRFLDTSNELASCHAWVSRRCGDNHVSPTNNSRHQWKLSGLFGYKEK